MAENTKPALPAHDWLYYRIHLDDIADVDGVLEQVVRPVMGSFRPDDPESRWFFLRFHDRSGPHLRLRMRAERSTLRGLERTLDHALNAAQADSACRSFGKFLYAPETAKFGQGSGTFLAERLFQRSSEVALNCLGSRQRGMRGGYAAALMALVLRVLPRRQHVAFLHQYAWYWSGGLHRHRAQPGFYPYDRRSVARASALAAQITHVMSEPAVRQEMETYGAAFWRAMRCTERRTVARSDYFLVFHHMHLMNNRIGVFPAAESSIARLMWIAELTGVSESIENSGNRQCS